MSDRRTTPPPLSKGLGLQRLLRRLLWVCLLPLALLATYLAWDRFDSSRESDRAAATERARDAALSIDLLLRGSAQTLDIFANLATDVDSPDGLAAAYREAQAFRRSWGAHVVLADPERRVIFSTRAPLGAALPPLPEPQTGRSAIDRAAASLKPATGDLVSGTVAGASLVKLAVPLLRDGRARFFLVATYEGDDLREWLARTALPAGWALSLLDGTGSVIARVAPPGFEAGVTATHRFEASLERAGWRTVVEIPDEVYRRSLLHSGVPLLAGVLGAILISAIGGARSVESLRRALASLLHRNSASGRVTAIVEVEEVRRQLEAAGDQERAANAARLQSEAKLRAAFEQAAVGMALVGLDGRFVEVNQKLCDLLGYAREELLARDFQHVTHPEDLAAGVTQMQRLLAGEITNFTQEKRYLRKDRTPVWASVSVAAVRGAGGSLDHLLAIVADLAARKAAESALQQSEVRFQAMLEQSIAGVYVIQDGRLTYVNARTREIFGYAPEEDFDPDPLAHVAPEERETASARIRERMESGEPAEYRIASLRKDGSRFLLGISARRAMLGGRWAILAVAQDVTERARADEDIARHVAELGHAIRSSVELVSRIGAIRDPYTHGHERRVGELATAIAAEMGLPARDVEGARVAGNLHDVGALSVPAEILSKARKLTTAELEMVRQHSQQGYDILQALKFPWPVAEVALQHHERLDGSGYPGGLKGDQIHPLTRIISVADVVEAMSSHRPFRPSLGMDAALAEIGRGRGAQYDARVVDACLRLIRERGYRLPD